MRSTPTPPWPDGLALEEERIDFGRHQKECRRRSPFAYTVMSPDGERCPGCAHTSPSKTADAGMLMRVRKDEAELLDRKHFVGARSRVAGERPFETVRYPVRSAP